MESLTSRGRLDQSRHLWLVEARGRPGNHTLVLSARQDNETVLEISGPGTNLRGKWISLVKKRKGVGGADLLHWCWVRQPWEVTCAEHLTRHPSSLLQTCILPLLLALALCIPLLQVNPQPLWPSNKYPVFPHRFHFPFHFSPTYFHNSIQRGCEVTVGSMFLFGEGLMRTEPRLWPMCGSVSITASY